MAEGGCLENSCSGDGTGGSNPPLSAIIFVAGMGCFVKNAWPVLSPEKGERGFAQRL